MVKLTEKQIFIGGLFVKHYKNTGTGACGAEIQEEFKEELQKKGIDTANKLIATISSLASENKNFFVKTKKMYKEKMLTCFTPNEKALETFKTDNKEKEEN